MSTDESRTGRGPAGDAFLALVHAFEPLLLWNEEMVVAQERRIERELRFTSSGDPLGLKEQIAPIREAVRLGRAAYDRLEAHGPEVADGAARLLTVVKLSGPGMQSMLRDEIDPLETALRKLTERPESVLKAEVEAETCPNCGELKVMDGPPCFGDDVCCEGPDGGPTQPCAGWGRYCCRCGRDYALGQLP